MAGDAVRVSLKADTTRDIEQDISWPALLRRCRAEEAVTVTHIELGMWWAQLIVPAVLMSSRNGGGTERSAGRATLHVLLICAATDADAGDRAGADGDVRARGVGLCEAQCSSRCWLV